uniref:Uncharacterized protein n=1 Tax=Siphoviridae sp. ctI8Q15 TaxID=2827832 RepID=A0A8S5SFQ0_9CAUD|nr:MAG TPA: hypothetical protein [Siphoviridae sp. ctI8Q15]
MTIFPKLTLNHFATKITPPPPASTSKPHQNQAKSHKMGWVCSQKLTLSPHSDKLSHYLLWPLLVFELAPPLLSEKPAPHRYLLAITLR